MSLSVPAGNKLREFVLKTSCIDPNTTAVAILRPALFREEEVSVDQGVEITVHLSEVDADNVVVNLTRGSAVLALNAAAMTPLLAKLVSSMSPIRMNSGSAWSRATT